MALHRFFLENQVLEQETDETFPLRLSAEDAKHARVLRLAPGEHIAVIDASTDYFECEVVDVSDNVVVRIRGHETTDVEGAQVILLQGLCKGDKFDAVVRHATEVGVAAFVPLSCSRSVVKLDAKKALSRKQRWESIAKSAAMQAGLVAIPEIADVVDVAQAADMVRGATCVLVCWEEARGLSIGQALEAALVATDTLAGDARVAVVVGPEGGLTPEEVAAFSAANDQTHVVTLGRNILRTETAGVVAPALAIYALGGLQ